MRTQTMRRGLAVGAAIGVATVAFGQDSISFAPRLSEGLQFSYRIDMRLGVSQTTGDAPAREASIASTATVRFIITEITPTGAAQAEMSVLQVQLDNNADGAETSYAWPHGAELPEDAPAASRLGETLAEVTIELFIADDGEVIIVSGLDSFVEVAQEIAGSKKHMLLGLFNPDSLGATLTPLFAVDGARSAERHVDDQWQAQRQAPIAPIGVMKLESSFSFTSYEAGLASYSGTTTFAIVASDDESNPGTKIEIIEQSGHTEGAFDTNAGLLRTRSRTMTVRTRWSLGDIAMEQSQDSTLRFTLIEPE